MNRWHLVLGGAIAGALLVSTSPQEVNAEDGEPQRRGSNQEATSPIPRRKELLHSAKTVKEWLAQVREAEVQAPVRVIEVKVAPTDGELEITLETENGRPLPIDATQFRTEGNSLVADIPNAVLALPDGQSSQSAFEEYTIRGFSSGFAGGNILRNGLRDATNISGIALPNIEQIEVLKGPAGALFGLDWSISQRIGSRFMPATVVPFCRMSAPHLNGRSLSQSAVPNMKSALKQTGLIANYPLRWRFIKLPGLTC